MKRPQDLEALIARIEEFIHPYAGRVEYGNLRMRISDWDSGEGDPTTNVALVYETPGGSTDQINVCYHHAGLQFSLIDADEGEIFTPSVDDVMAAIDPRVVNIPRKRLEALFAEIAREIDSGCNTAGLFGRLNRIVQSDFKGGSITHIELKEAMTYAINYMKSGCGAPK